ncbi:MAG: hypothetical protein ACI8Y8_002040 [Planctomycetota bacterium]|jgi:hypothetical protein
MRLGVIAIVVLAGTAWILGRSKSDPIKVHAVTTANPRTRVEDSTDTRLDTFTSSTTRIDSAGDYSSTTTEPSPSARPAVAVDARRPSSDGARKQFLGYDCVISWEGDLRRVRFDSGEVFSEGVFVDRLREGVHRGWNRRGQLSSSGNYSRNRRVGHWLWYHENGQIDEEGVFVKGVKAGEWRTYFEDGRQESVGLYENGLREGYWAFYSEEDDTLDPEKSGFYVENNLLPEESQ